MPKIQVRRGTEQEIGSIIPDVGEPFYVTDTKKMGFGDGVNTINTIKNKADTDLSNTTDTAKITMSNMAMPEITKYENLTVGSSGASYTAPSNGYVSATGQTASETGAYLYLQTTTYGTSIISSGAGQSLQLNLPIKKGTSFTFSYLGYSSVSLTFTYAVGSESEAS